jgi:hypothetical protein
VCLLSWSEELDYRHEAIPSIASGATIGDTHGATTTAATASASSTVSTRATLSAAACPTSADTIGEKVVDIH